MSRNVNAGEILSDMGYEDAVIFDGYSYDSALIGVTVDGRAVYDYNKMVQYLEEEEEMDELEAVEWIDYNTIRALPYAGPNGPIVMYPIMEDEDEGTSDPS